jgi:hypothetical protein
MKPQATQKQRSTILGLSAKGLKAPEIAKRIGLSMPTVRSIIIRHERADSWTRKPMTPWQKMHIAEAQSKDALRLYCEEHKWHVGFFEGKTGAPRTGIIDAIIFRISKQNADTLELRLVQLKGGHAGASGAEIARLKKASEAVAVDWMIAAFDGESLHLLSDDPGPTMEKRKTNTKRRARAKQQIAAIEAALMQPVVSTKPL